MRGEEEKKKESEKDKESVTDRERGEKREIEKEVILKTKLK